MILNWDSFKNRNILSSN